MGYEYVYIYDRKLKMYVVHVIKGSKAISLLTGDATELTNDMLKDLEKSTSKNKRKKPRGERGG